MFPYRATRTTTRVFSEPHVISIFYSWLPFTKTNFSTDTAQPLPPCLSSLLFSMSSAPTPQNADSSNSSVLPQHLSPKAQPNNSPPIMSQLPDDQLLPQPSQRSDVRPLMSNFYRSLCISLMCSPLMSDRLSLFLILWLLALDLV